MQELLTMQVSDLEAVETAAEVATRIQRNMTLDEEHERFETLHRRKDGSVFDVEISAQFLPEGRGEGMVFLRNITARKEAEDALRISLAEKEVLLKEVHHRVKNNLAAIMGLVDLQEQALDNQAARTALAELSARIRSMALVHEQLYQSENLSRIDFQSYLESLISHLRSSYERFGGIHVSVAAEGVEMGLDNAVPCGLLITELITNAYKYAFPAGRPRPGTGGCEIAVLAAWDGATYTLTVADNGVGLPEDLDWTNTKTLGLLLVKMLGHHQLQGTIEVDRTLGTTFRLQFTPKNR
jgi:two-component sensor histidine kinase